MSDYTPTTDEVREAHVVGVDPEVTARYRAEFDRWLAEVERAAAAEALTEFADAQDSWCEQGQGTQVISRVAMRDALRARAEAYRREGGESA